MSAFIDRDGASGGGGGGGAYSEDTFDMTVTGVVGVVTVTAQVIQIGNLLTLCIPQTPVAGFAESNSVDKLMGTIPEAYRPIRNYSFFMIPVNAGSSRSGGGLVQTSGVLNLLLYSNSTNVLGNFWTASGNWLLNGFTVTYPLI